MQYLWTAHVDGAAFQPSIRSKQYSTPFRPIICAPLPVPCALEDWLYKFHNCTPYAHAKVLLSQQVFCPGKIKNIKVVKRKAYILLLSKMIGLISNWRFDVYLPI